MQRGEEGVPRSEGRGVTVDMRLEAWGGEEAVREATLHDAMFRMSMANQLKDGAACSRALGPCW